MLHTLPTMNTAMSWVLAIACLATAQHALSQITIGIRPLYGVGGDFVNDSQVSSLMTWAGTFQTPDSANVQLNEFGLYFLSSNSVSFTAAVAEWNTTDLRLAGAPLWISPQQTVSSSDLTSFIFDTGGLVLNPTKTYALLALADYTSNGSAGQMGLATLTTSNTYLISLAAGGTYGTLASQAWGPSSSYDLAYATAFDLVGGNNSFTSIPPVPEPAIPGLTIGLCGLAAYSVWRRKKTVGGSAVASAA